MALFRRGFTAQLTSASSYYESDASVSVEALPRTFYNCSSSSYHRSLWLFFQPFSPYPLLSHLRYFSRPSTFFRLQHRFHTNDLFPDYHQIVKLDIRNIVLHIHKFLSRFHSSTHILLKICIYIDIHNLIISNEL